MIELEHLNEKYGDYAPSQPTKFLYHGTSKTKPSEIYMSEEGFDMRFSNEGMWGRAVYFAQNSLYSNNYCFTTITG